jgi:hypothetical protein
MKNSRFGGCAVGVCVAFAMLGGCGGQASTGGVPSVAPNSLPNHKSFYYTGAAQDFTVPAGVTEISVVARGAKGAGKRIADGGRVHAVIPVTPGETLVLYIGGDASGATGGFNGGGGGGGSAVSGGGGGASDVREGGTSLGDRIIVSGGGGGAGAYGHGTGGKGGGKTGGTGGCGQVPSSGSVCGQFGGAGGYGGAQSAGGQGGAGGQCFTSYGTQGESGALGIGGNGSGEVSGAYGSPGGGGGGGYYGGGGGGSGCSYGSSGGGGGGGGGGSSYAERRATDVHMWQGWKQSAHNGLVVLSWQ